MDITVNTAKFKDFLQKCYCGGDIKDLIIQIDSENGMSARFINVQRDRYGEVYLSDLRIVRDGVVRIADLKNLIDCINRTDADLIRMVATEDDIAITDGGDIGTMRVILAQGGIADLIQSNQGLQEAGKIFDKDTLTYVKIRQQYTAGCEVTSSLIYELLKDAKVFNCETYTFRLRNNARGSQLIGTVRKPTGEKFERVIADAGIIGELPLDMTYTVGSGFRGFMDAAIGKKRDKDDANIIKIYFNEYSILITDGVSYFYNLHTSEE